MLQSRPNLFLALWRTSHDEGTHSGRRTSWDSTQLSAVIVAVGVALAVAVVVWRGRVRRLNRENPEARCRRDIQTL